MKDFKDISAKVKPLLLTNEIKLLKKAIKIIRNSKDEIANSYLQTSNVPVMVVAPIKVPVMP